LPSFNRSLATEPSEDVDGIFAGNDDFSFYVGEDLRQRLSLGMCPMMDVIVRFIYETLLVKSEKIAYQQCISTKKGTNTCDKRSFVTELKYSISGAARKKAEKS